MLWHFVKLQLPNENEPGLNPEIHPGNAMDLRIQLRTVC